MPNKKGLTLADLSGLISIIIASPILIVISFILGGLVVFQMFNLLFDLVFATLLVVAVIISALISIKGIRILLLSSLITIIYMMYSLIMQYMSPACQIQIPILRELLCAGQSVLLLIPNIITTAAVFSMTSLVLVIIFIVKYLAMGADNV